MRAPTTLTREEFNQAANDLIARRNSKTKIQGSVFEGWEWHNHPNWPSLGYIFRTTFVSDGTEGLAQDTDLLLEDFTTEDIPDDAEATIKDQHRSLRVEQHVAWSASFQVPAFYFTVFDPSGSPLPIDRAVTSTLFRNARSSMDWSSLRVTSITVSPLLDSTEDESTSVFPLLTQGDHPVLGTPCWYIHPCQTSLAMKELLDEVVGDEWASGDPDKGLVRWLETWFMMLGGIVDMRG